MMRLVLLAFSALVAFTSATTLTVGADRCTWGPGYWCQSLQESSECSATRHCIANVWMDRQLEQDDDDVCTICKNMVKEARDTLRSNETQEELMEVFHGSCKLIPVKIISDECMTLTDQFIVQLVETLSSEMNPQLVCATAGLCNSERIDKLLANYHLVHPAVKSECSICQAQSNVIVSSLQQLSRDQLLDKMLEACGYLGSYSDACQLTLLDNFEMIRAGVRSMEENDLCHASGLCLEDTSPAVYSSNDVQCEFCEKVIQHWVDTWTANTTEEEFKTVLEQLCKKLDKPSRVDHCLHIVDDWYLPWFQFLLHEIDPHTLCGFAGLCGANKVFMKVSDTASIMLLLDHQDPTNRFDEDNEDELRHIPLTRLNPALEYMTGQDEDEYIRIRNVDEEEAVEPNRLIGGYFTSQTALELQKPGCVICEYVMESLNKALGTNRTEAAIEKELDMICDRLPSAVEEQCVNYVSTYAPAIIQMLANEMDPSAVCLRLSLCTTNLLKQQSLLPPQLAMLRRGSDNCALCQFAMGEVFSFLNSTSDQEMIKNVLDTVCYHLPSSVANECEKLVAEYANVVMGAVVAGLNGDQICAEIKMCAAKEVPVTDQKCVLCEYAVTTLDSMIVDKHNEAQVKQALERICAYLPSSISKQCTSFVDTYSDIIIDMIAKDLTPEQICQELGLCDAIFVTTEYDVNLIENADALIAASDSEDDSIETRPYCTLCEYAIGQVDKMISDRHNEDEVKHALDAICYELSQPIQKECVSMVNKYTDMIIDMFVAEYTPEQVCKELKMCAVNVDDYSNNQIMGNELSMDNDMMTNELPAVDERDIDLINAEKPLCALCEFSMSILEKKLITNRTLDMVEHMVQMVCSYLPRVVAEPCEDFVDDYGDEIVHAIIDMELDPKQVCAQIQLCKETQQQQPKAPAPMLVGGRRCSWGPAFWCASRFHASQCGTIKHCEDNVWNK